MLNDPLRTQPLGMLSSECAGTRFALSQSAGTRFAGTGKSSHIRIVLDKLLIYLS